MPKVKTLQSNFSSGELSPQASGRVDVARYQGAAKRLVNVVPRLLGGVKKRPGTQYTGVAKHTDQRARLIPFVLGQDSAFMLELGAGYARVFNADGSRVLNGASVFEFSTPYTVEQVHTLDYAHGEDGMYLFHQDVPPNRLRSLNSLKWECTAAPFTAMPFAELGIYPNARLTLSSNVIGAGRTITADTAVFLAADVGRAILWGTGVAVITGYTSTTVVTVEVKSLFDSTTIPQGEWNLDSSPQASLTPSAKDPVGATISMTLSADGWRAADVGKYVRLNAGLVKLTAYTSTTVMSGVIVTELSAPVAAPALAWTLESAAWNALDGYPTTGTFHEQRLIAAGTRSRPQTVWGSRIGEPLDFTLGVDDDMAFEFALAGEDSQINQVRFMVSQRNLLALTFGGEYSISGGTEKPLTPTNVQVRPQSPEGVNAVRPVSVGKETLFVQRGKRRLRALGYSFDDDGYLAADLTTLAEHITASGVVEIALQQLPEPVVWAVLENGQLVSLTYDKQLDVVAWARHDLGGAVESVAVLPAGDDEHVWLVVRRTINSSPVRYIERMDQDWQPVLDASPTQDEPYRWGYTLDCAIAQDDAAGKTAWGNLQHLEGETVRVLADGSDMGDFTVSGGQITLPRAARRTLIGYLFTPLVELLTPELQFQTGTAQASAMSTNEIILRVVDTLGALVNGEQVVPARALSDAQLDQLPPLFSGDVSASLTGWEKGASPVVITQDTATPFHLLAVIRSITVNEG